MTVHQLIREGRVVASSAWFEAAQRASYYQGGRIVDDPSLRGAGTVLMAEAIRRARKLARKQAQREGLIAAPKKKEPVGGRPVGHRPAPFQR